MFQCSLRSAVAAGHQRLASRASRAHGVGNPLRPLAHGRGRLGCFRVCAARERHVYQFALPVT
eukprot:3399033-Lingulodinium_polyedra.AAC.1